MKRFVLILIIIAFFVCWQEKVVAAEAEISNTTFEVSVINENDLRIVQTAYVQNLSTDSRVSLIRFDFPYDAIDVETYIDGPLHKSRYGAKGVTIEVDLQSMRQNKKSQVVIKYTVTGLTYSRGPVHRIFWPAYSGNTDKSGYSVIFTIPSHWGNVSYSSADFTETLDNENRILKYNTNSKFVFTTGYPKAVKIKTAWKINKENLDTDSTRIPIPYGCENNFQFQTLENATNGARDKDGSAYIIIGRGENTNLIGAYSGMMNIQEINLDVSMKQSSYFKGSNDLEIDKHSEIEVMYRELIEAFNPDLTYPVWDRDTVSASIIKDQQNSLDYANALVGQLRKSNIKAKIVYGIVDFSEDNKQYLHYWVMFENKDEQIVQVDPYMEDVYGFDFFHSMPPLRFVFGIVNDDDDTAVIGIQNILNDDLSIEFLDTAIAMDVQLDYEVIFDIPNHKLSGFFIPAQLIVRNNMQSILFLDSVHVKNISLDDNDLSDIIILPQSFEIIDIGSVFILNPFSNAKKVINGEIQVSSLENTDEYVFSKEFTTIFEYKNTKIAILVTVGISLVLTAIIRKKFDMLFMR